MIKNSNVVDISKCLNKRDSKDFENAYQWLNNFPGWKMENVFLKKTFEHNECEKYSRVFYIRGRKQNRLIVASHEAGHAIVEAATYGYVKEAVIDVEDHLDGWLGWVKSGEKHKGANDCQQAEQESKMPCKPEIIRYVLIKSAGFVGESLVGEKTGSNHERFLIYCGCRYLDDLSGAEQLNNWSYYINWCRNIILNNENLFWRTTDDLLANSKLTESLKTLLHKRIKKEPADLFF